MSAANRRDYYKLEDTRPKSSANALDYWWGRLVERYYPFKVKVLGRSPPDQRAVQDIITVELVGDAVQGLPVDHPSRQKVDIDLLNTTAVWADLPSTAQLVPTPVPSTGDVFGFLFLTEAWAKGKFLIPITDYSEGGGGKWPIGASKPSPADETRFAASNFWRSLGNETSSDDWASAFLFIVRAASALARQSDIPSPRNSARSDNEDEGNAS